MEESNLQAHSLVLAQLAFSVSPEPETTRSGLALPINQEFRQPLTDMPTGQL